MWPIDKREKFDELAGKFEFDAPDFFPTRQSAEVEANIAMEEDK